MPPPSVIIFSLGSALGMTLTVDLLTLFCPNLKNQQIRPSQFKNTFLNVFCDLVLWTHDLQKVHGSTIGNISAKLGWNPFIGLGATAFTIFFSTSGWPWPLNQWSLNVITVSLSSVLANAINCDQFHKTLNSFRRYKGERTDGETTRKHYASVTARCIT